MRLGRLARLLAGAWIGAALLAGCAHRAPLAGAQLAGLPASVELTDTPFFPQERYQCGPAALASVLSARGAAVTPEELVPQVYLPARKGSLQAEIMATVRRRGLLTVPVEPSLDAVLAEIAAGHPVLVLQNLGLDWLPRWHYAVAIGYDLPQQVLILRSGTERRRITPFGVFMNTWERSMRWGIVVLTPGSFPARAEPGAYLEAVSALEGVGKRAEAQAAYKASTERWPDSLVAWLGRGNAEYALGQAAHAEASFRQALQVQAGAGAAWNNLAYALAARQCIRAARQAARCAKRLSPGHAAFTHTLMEMDTLQAPGAGACLPLPACPAH
ncbi:MAG: PA2778 family cysteine peptidase [Gammaproteobacteria bacterium]|nr:PA2778 family cysteine peptidase [Gammaproteobacteria bacterium]MBU1408465.1 PA2778 family cysteine peptidase [Gammaproteobacteria bacterium]MBU1532277.1 PA2778 family cysteine peptidase [Gammaproteobacteria bacterium]